MQHIFKELLISEDYRIRLDSWDRVTDLIDKGIISNEEAIEKKEYFKELLISEDYRIRSSAWYMIIIVKRLIDKGIMNNEEVTDMI